MSASTQTERFHTVVIRGDLPQIPKQYRADKPADLPEASYWIDQVAEDVVGNRWDGRNQSSRFKIQHMISNGPRKLRINYRITLYRGIEHVQKLDLFF